MNHHSSKYTVFTPEEAARHRDAMMHAEFDEKAAAMRKWGATEDEIAEVRARAVALKLGAPFMRWIADRARR